MSEAIVAKQLYRCGVAIDWTSVAASEGPDALPALVTALAYARFASAAGHALHAAARPANAALVEEYIRALAEDKSKAAAILQRCRADAEHRLPHVRDKERYRAIIEGPDEVEESDEALTLYAYSQMLGAKVIVIQEENGGLVLTEPVYCEDGSVSLERAKETAKDSFKEDSASAMIVRVQDQFFPAFYAAFQVTMTEKISRQLLEVLGLFLLARKAWYRSLMCSYGPQRLQRLPRR